MADERVQPVPCVERVWRRGWAKRWTRRPAHQQVDHLVPFRVPPLGEHGRPARRQRPGRPQPLLLGATGQAGQRLELGQVGGHQGRERQQLGSRAPRRRPRAAARSPLLAIITGSRTMGIARVPPRWTRSRSATARTIAGARQHADLDRVGADVLEDGVDLRRHHLRRHLVDGAHLAGVLGGERGDHAHAVGAVGGEGLEVGLDAGAASGVRAGDGEEARAAGGLMPSAARARPRRSQATTPTRSEDGRC